MRTVLWLRESDADSRSVQDAGIQVLNVPLIATVPLEDLSDLDRAVARLVDYNGIFITSRAAAEIIAGRAAREIRESAVPVFVLGRRSTEILKSTITNLVFFPDAGTASEMLESLDGRLQKNGRYLFVRGERSLRTVPDTLTGYASVDECVVYRTIRSSVVKPELEKVKGVLNGPEKPLACFFSPSAVEVFADLFGAEGFNRIDAASIGETTAAALRDAGVQPVLVAPRASGRVLADGVIELLRHDR
jgi:uroporphyrinogen-III synthase